jgi:hypothetical protein
MRCRSVIHSVKTHEVSFIISQSVRSVGYLHLFLLSTLMDRTSEPLDVIHSIKRAHLISLCIVSCYYDSGLCKRSFIGNRRSTLSSIASRYFVTINPDVVIRFTFFFCLDGS